MTYEEIFEKAKERLLKAKVKDVKDSIAIQFNIVGEGHGAFYAVIFDGKIDVQPYDYKDNDISVNVSGDELIAALESKTADTLAFHGNDDKIAVLMPLLTAIPKAKKVSENTSKPAVKKSAPVKKSPRKKI